MNLNHKTTFFPKNVHIQVAYLKCPLLKHIIFQPEMILQSVLKLSMKWTYCLIHTHTYCIYIQQQLLFKKMIKIKYTHFTKSWLELPHQLMTDIMMFTLNWLISACILTQMLFYIPHPQFEQDPLSLSVLFIFCASHVWYGLRTQISAALGFFYYVLLSWPRHLPGFVIGHCDSVLNLKIYKSDMSTLPSHTHKQKMYSRQAVATFYKQHHATNMNEDGWREKERNRWINKHSLTILYHSLIDASLRHPAQMLLVSFWNSFLFFSFLMFFMLVFLQNPVFFPLLPRVRLEAGLYKMWQNTNILKICSSAEMFDSVFTTAIFSIFFSPGVLFLLAGICSHRGWLSSRTGVHCQRKRGI